MYPCRRGAEKQYTSAIEYCATAVVDSVTAKNFPAGATHQCGYEPERYISVCNNCAPRCTPTRPGPAPVPTTCTEPPPAQNTLLAADFECGLGRFHAFDPDPAAGWDMFTGGRAGTKSFRAHYTQPELHTSNHRSVYLQSDAIAVEAGEQVMLFWSLFFEEPVGYFGVEINDKKQWFASARDAYLVTPGEWQDFVVNYTPDNDQDLVVVRFVFDFSGKMRGATRLDKVRLVQPMPDGMQRYTPAVECYEGRRAGALLFADFDCGLGGMGVRLHDTSSSWNLVGGYAGKVFQAKLTQVPARRLGPLGESMRLVTQEMRVVPGVELRLSFLALFGSVKKASLLVVENDGVIWNHTSQDEYSRQWEKKALVLTPESDTLVLTPESDTLVLEFLFIFSEADEVVSISLDDVLLTTTELVDLDTTRTGGVDDQVEVFSQGRV